MTLDEALLEKLANWRPSGGRQTLTVPHAETGWQIHLTAECVDVVGCRLWELQVEPTGPVSNLTDIKTRAAQVAGRVTGLLEPLQVVEVDEGARVAQLRSRTPARRGDQLFYYEVTLNQDRGARLGRYQAAHQDQARQQVAFTLTHEALANLVTDLSR